MTSASDNSRQSAVMESPAQMVKAVPLTLLATTGTLRLAGGRLSFHDRRGGALLDLPVGELHSVSQSAMGVTVWHGSTRYRFATGEPRMVGSSSTAVGLAVGLARLPGDLAAARASREAAFMWVDTLTPLVMAQPPAGVTVKKPWKAWQWVATVTGVVLGIVAVIVLLALI